MTDIDPFAVQDGSEAIVATALGVLMGLAGLAGWHVHPDALATLLS